LADWANNKGMKSEASIFSVIVLMVGGCVLAVSSTLTTTSTTGLPLTEAELREQNRLLNVTTAITHNLQQGEMKINGIVYTPRWSDPVWTEPNSLSVLFVNCFPSEYADSGQQILDSRDLDVLESYSFALSPVLTGSLR
jgi:hypothetical protein